MGILFNIWMLPILFILHDFEEMIFMPLWKKRHHRKLLTFKKPFFGSVTQGSAFRGVCHFAIYFWSLSDDS